MTETKFDGSVLDEWIESASLTRHSVTIYGRPGLVVEFEQLERELEQLDEADQVRRGEIVERLTDLFDQWQASKSTWIVEDVSHVNDEVRAATGAEPSRSPGVDRWVAQRILEQDVAAWNAEYVIQLIARAVVKIRFVDGHVADGVTVEQVRTLRERLGEGQLARLAAAARDAMTEQPVLTRPQATPSVDSGEATDRG